MADLQLNPLRILHYNIEADINDVAVNDAFDPLIGVFSSETYGGKHLQIRVMPFNDANQDKIVLPFADKLQYYRKEIRTGLKEPSTLQQISEDSNVLASLVSAYFDAEDGFDDEFAEFMDGWNNKPITGYEGNLIGFFSGHYLGLPSEALTSLQTGLGVV